MKKFLKYKYLKRAKSFNRYNKRILNFKRPKYRKLIHPINKGFKFTKRSIIRKLSLLKKEKFPKKFSNLFLEKIFNKFNFKVKSLDVNKVIDSFPISVKTNKYTKVKKSFKKKVKLNLVYKLTFGKTLKRKYDKISNVSRWEFLQKKFFKNYYSIAYILPKYNYYRSLREAKQQISYSNIFLNGSKVTNFRSQNLKQGDIFEVKKTRVFLKKNRNRFLNRGSLFPFLEIDNYSQNFAVCKDLSELSRSDGILINPGSKGLVSVNFLKL